MKEDVCLASVLSSKILDATQDRGRDSEDAFEGVCCNVIGVMLEEAISLAWVLSSIILNVTRDRGCVSRSVVKYNGSMWKLWLLKFSKDNMHMIHK